LNKKIATIFIILLVVVAVSVSLYIQNQYESQRESSYSESLKNIVVKNSDSNFSTPVSMYRALQIAFEGKGWDATKFNESKVVVALVYGYVNETSSYTTILNVLSRPVSNYSIVQVNGTTYRYIWEIAVYTTNYNSTGDLMPLADQGFYLVDAVTGEILPNPIGVLSPLF
jgi:uncharacterized protein YxeA